jgi:hypothetical protein
MATIDDFIMQLKDGEWHDIQEVTEHITLPRSKAEMVINFLGEYDFIQQKGDKKIRLQTSMLEFIKGIQRLEETGF